MKKLLTMGLIMSALSATGTQLQDRTSEKCRFSASVEQVKSTFLFLAAGTVYYRPIRIHIHGAQQLEGTRGVCSRSIGDRLDIQLMAKRSWFDNSSLEQLSNLKSGDAVNFVYQAGTKLAYVGGKVKVVVYRDWMLE